jgi:hypothetical protein
VTYTSPWAVGFEPRLDKKCGASAIPDNATCRKGAGNAVRRGLENAAVIGGLTTFGGGLIQGQRLANRGNFKGAMRSLQAASAGQALAGAGLMAKGARTKNSATSQIGGRLVGGGVVTGVLATKHAGDFKRVRSAAEKGISSIGKRARSAVYAYRSGRPKHSGYLPTNQARPFNPTRKRPKGGESFTDYFPLR